MLCKVQKGVMGGIRVTPLEKVTKRRANLMPDRWYWDVNGTLFVPVMSVPFLGISKQQHQDLGFGPQQLDVDLSWAIEKKRGQ